MLWSINFHPRRVAKKMMASSNVSGRMNTRLHSTWYFTVIGPTPVKFIFNYWLKCLQINEPSPRPHWDPHSSIHYVKQQRTRHIHLYSLLMQNLSCRSEWKITLLSIFSIWLCKWDQIKYQYGDDPKFSDRLVRASSAPSVAVWSRSTMFAYPSAPFGRMTLWQNHKISDNYSIFSQMPNFFWFLHYLKLPLLV